MRPLFLSEKRCVSNLFQMKWGGPSPAVPQVLSETIAEPVKARRMPWFNCDFILHFVDWRASRSQRTAAACSVLPNALGGELFLVVEKENLSPTALELNGGSAFPMDRYDHYIEIVDVAVRDATEAQGERNTELYLDKAARGTGVRKAAFARVLIVGSDITFLYFPSQTNVSIGGNRISLARRDDREIDCYLEAGEVLCFDGWIKTDVVASENVLISVPDPLA